MHLSTSELDILQAIIGTRVERLFCPHPDIFPDHIETTSYTIWLDEAPYFVNIYAVGEDNHLRIAIERTETPKEFQHDYHPLAGEKGMVSNCSAIWVYAHDPGIVRQIKIFEFDGRDSTLVFGFDEGDQFALDSGQVTDEVSYFRANEFDWVEKNCTLRSVIPLKA